MHATCLTKLYNESSAPCNVERIYDSLEDRVSFPGSIVRYESSALAYRTFTIEPRLLSQIARFAFPRDTHIMQSHIAHNGDLSQGSRNFPSLNVYYAP